MIPFIPATQAPAAFEDKQGSRRAPLIAFSVGGPAIRADSLDGTQWVAEYVTPDVVLYKEDSPTDRTVLFTLEGITEISLAFDQSMNPIIAYVVDRVAKMWWFDNFLGGYAVLDLGASNISPRVCLDLREQVLLASSDVILSYVRERGLYCRVQRERFQTERLLVADAGSYLVNFGRAVTNRPQWRLMP